MLPDAVLGEQGTIHSANLLFSPVLAQDFQGSTNLPFFLLQVLLITGYFINTGQVNCKILF
ncbi:hypothetical protein ES703_55340 [subsurface metagenome]